MSDIANAIYRHLRTMAPHQLERLTASQLREAADEIARLRAELSVARQQAEAGQPVLSDAEREAISAAACICEDAGRTDIAIVINEAMARLEGER
jgi:hypothetical protein